MKQSQTNTNDKRSTTFRELDISEKLAMLDGKNGKGGELARLGNSDAECDQWKCSVAEYARAERKLFLFRPRTDAGKKKPKNMTTLFGWLMCGKLGIRKICTNRACDIPGKIQRRSWCRCRFLCAGCREWVIEEQRERWLRSLRRTMRESSLYWGRATKLVWRIPDADEPENVAKFSRYIQQTFAAERDGWILFTCYDAILSEVRGLYLGPQPPHTPQNIDRNIRTKTPLSPSFSTDVSSKGTEGRPSPWQPRTSGAFYILGSESDPGEVFDRVWDKLRHGLGWVAGRGADIECLTPERALTLEERYAGARLFGQHGVQRAKQTVEEAIPTLMIERSPISQHAEPQLGIYDGRECAGRMVNQFTEPDLTGELESERRMIDGDRCPHCGAKLADEEVKFHFQH